MGPPSPQVDRFSAFSSTPDGGNPAGVVLDAGSLSAAAMQQIAAEVGYSETVFLTERGQGAGAHLRVRYFSPVAEVDFCGHATIALGVALGEHPGPGDYRLITNAGPVGLMVRRIDGVMIATLESPPASALPLPAELLHRLLTTLGWSVEDLHPDYPAMVGTSGNQHPVLVAGDVSRLAVLDYDFPALQALCRQQRWTTVHLVAPLAPGRWRARDPFPLGGVVEDPATGAAAAAFAGYLRHLGKARTGDRFMIEQGVEMGRPSLLEVELRAATVLVSGTAAKLV